MTNDVPADQPEQAKPKLEAEVVYEQMYFAMLDCKLGKITFLEMMDKWEVIVGIKPPQSKEDEQT